jgi:WD40 repeat protein
MATLTLGSLSHELGWDSPAPSDADLLEQFIARRDQMAFSRMVSAHGPLAQASAQGSVSPALLSHSTSLLTNKVTPSIQAMASGVMHTMLLAKLKSLSLLCLLLFIVSLAGWGLMTTPSQAQDRSGLPTEQPLKPTPAAHWVYASVFHPDGERLIISEGLGKVRLWDSRTNQPGAVFTGPKLAVHSLSVSPDGKLLAGGSQDKNLYVWDLATQQLQYQVTLLSTNILSVTFSADSSMLAAVSLSGLENSTVTVLESSTGKKLKSWRQRDGVTPLNAGMGLAFHPRRKELAVLQYGIFTGVVFTDLDTGKVRQLEYESPLTIQSMVYSPDGKYLVTGGMAPPLRVPNDRRLFGSYVGHLKLWDVEKGEQIQTLFDDSDGDVKAMAFSQDGQRLYAATTMKMDDPVQTPQGLIVKLGASVQCWDVNTWKPMWDTRISGGQTYGLALAPKQDRLMIANTAGCWLFEELATGTKHRLVAETRETPLGR